MQIATGTQDFTELVKSSDKIVDKTLLIKEIIEDRAKVILITAPRRWGKSVNMSMLKTFLEKKVDKDGNPIDRAKTDGYKVFYGGEVDRGFGDKKDLVALKIFSDEKVNESVKKRQGQYPVIYLDFKDCKGNSYEEVENSVKKKICRAFQEHRYLLKSDKLEKDQKEQIQKFINSDPSLTITDINDGIRFLSECLHAHHEQKVWILIDEYDVPINSSFTKLDEPTLEKVIDLFRGIFSSALKGNDENLEKGVLTGILRIAKANLFSGLNNLTEYTVLEGKYCKHYGFEEEEVEKELLATLTKEQKDKIKQWYNGYQAFDENEGKLMIYNPFSVVNCITQNLKISPYWADSGASIFEKNTHNLFKDENILSNIKHLLNEEDSSIEISLEKSLTLENFQKLKEISNSKSELEMTENSRNLFFSYLYHAGYFSLAEKPQEESNIVKFTLPNNEIRQAIAKKIIDYYVEKYGIFPVAFTNLGNGILKYIDTQEEGGIKILEKMLSNSKIDKMNEHAIHDIVFASILMTNGNTSKKRSDVWLDRKGRPDITFDYKKEKVLIELKWKGSLEGAKAQNDKYAKSILNESYQKIHGITLNVKELNDNSNENKYKVEIEYTIYQKKCKSQGVSL